MALLQVLHSILLFKILHAEKILLTSTIHVTLNVTDLNKALVMEVNF